MLSRGVARAARTVAPAARCTSVTARSFSVQAARRADAYEGTTADPEQNGNYENPPAIKRSLRDPYGDYFDKQERRYWNEPVHEDNDILAVFSTEEYRHFTPGHGAKLMGAFIATVLALCGACYITYPDKPAAPRIFEGGLEAELGGANAIRARQDGEDHWVESSEES